MANRVSASITIGGDLSANLLDAFVKIIRNDGLSTEWDGEPFDVSELPKDNALRLMAHEAAWGRFEELEAFCVANALPFARWSEAYSGEWSAERTVFTGFGAPQCYAADDDDNIVICREVVDRLGILEAIIAHFEAADFPIPPLVVIDEAREADHG